jgi:two-component system, OmpR family, sensor histidine kinase RstB
VLILFAALILVTFAFQYRMDVDFNHVKERATRGGVRRAKEALAKTPDDALVPPLKDLESQFGYPFRIIASDQVPAVVRESVSKGEDVVVHVGNELSVLTSLGTSADVLQIGPVSLPAGEIETDMKLALGAVLLLGAIVIAVLLRPFARQLGDLEQTAISIAGGNLAARVDVQRASSAKALAQAFNDMAARIEVLLRTQRELLQAVSHELRTPLARINFAIDLIRTARDDNERESRLKSLDTAAQDLDELVGELLQYVRLETSGLRPASESIELLPLVAALIDKESLGSESIQCEVGPELASGKVHVVADRAGLTRALGNLLANACRFGRRRVIVNATASAGGTTIDIDDDGPGIPAADRERVFEPFVRLDESSRGAGLGLALVKRIVTNHGGTVTASESPLGGCRNRTFWPASANPQEQA